LATVRQLEQRLPLVTTPVLYVGDTVADIYTVQQARCFTNRYWIGVGILPPHVQETLERRDAYADTLIVAGAAAIFSNIEQLSLVEIQELLRSKSVNLIPYTGLEELLQGCNHYRVASDAHLLPSLGLCSAGQVQPLQLLSASPVFPVPSRQR